MLVLELIKFTQVTLTRGKSEREIEMAMENNDLKQLIN